ncbi:ABC-type transport auxiliary lipoprotein family protein [Halomonas sp. NO4]|uniref:PqiC family protein n=1 Tax=Halomonas sp. NO4 TaxID=2484813 RepID=UPI0013D8A538|nr:ABC-type transport auxiliary lipoprotein family protein [Halomonas sp. NO4]
MDTAKRALILVAALAPLLWLGGCATSSPPAQRYTLPADLAAVSPPPASPAQLLRVQTPRLARYLDVEGIVLQLDDITLNEARSHVWAEPLPLQLERTLRARLAANLPDTRVLRSDDTSPGPVLTLALDVDRFQGHYDGTAHVAGQWQLRDSDGESLIVEDFRATTELASDGYPALVRALGESWKQVADAISTALRRRE